MKLKCDKLLSNIAFNCNLRHYTLEVAAWQGHAHVVDYLLRRGADPNRRDYFGVAALHKAVVGRCKLTLL